MSSNFRPGDALALQGYEWVEKLNLVKKHLHVGNGVPSASLGIDNDFYFRRDGTAAGATCIYHKEGGSWVALV